MELLRDRTVGSLVYLRVDGEYAPFRVMHHGKPSSLYDDSFLNGTILCKDYAGKPFSTQMVTGTGGGKITYAQSFLHEALNQTFLSKLDPVMQKLAREVKLPYRTDIDGAPYQVATGSSGLSAKIWVPSISEVTDRVQYEEGMDGPYAAEGALFDYWKDADDATYRRWGCLDHSENDMGWGTRTPNLYPSGYDMAPYFLRMSMYGYGYAIVDNNVAVWPCLVMPDTLVVDGTNCLHASGAMPVKVGGAWIEGTAWCRINGVWTEAEAVSAKVGGSWKE